MMRIRLADTADVDRWDRYVERSAKCSAYHRWAYRSALEDAYGLRTRYLVAENDQGDVTGILPSARIPRLGGPGSLCALPYCDLGGPVADNPAIEPAPRRRALCRLQKQAPLTDQQGTEERARRDRRQRRGTRGPFL